MKRQQLVCVRACVRARCKEGFVYHTVNC